MAFSISGALALFIWLVGFLKTASISPSAVTAAPASPSFVIKVTAPLSANSCGVLGLTMRPCLFAFIASSSAAVNTCGCAVVSCISTYALPTRESASDVIASFVRKDTVPRFPPVYCLPEATLESLPNPCRSSGIPSPEATEALAGFAVPFCTPLLTPLYSVFKVPSMLSSAPSFSNARVLLAVSGKVNPVAASKAALFLPPGFKVSICALVSVLL